MMIKRIDGATRVLGKSQGYLGLPIRDVKLNCTVGGEGTPAMITAWEPTPDEIERLRRGAPIYLTVLGSAHPPVLLQVGELPVAPRCDDACHYSRSINQPYPRKCLKCGQPEPSQ